jgi:hypothetical protein
LANDNEKRTKNPGESSSKYLTDDGVANNSKGSLKMTMAPK